MLSPIEISGKSVRLPLYCAAGTLLRCRHFIALPALLLRCRHSGKTDSRVALSGIFIRLGYYGLWYPSRRTLQTAVRVLLIFRKPDGKEPPLGTSDAPGSEFLMESEKRYGECCPKCGRDRLQGTGESERHSMPYHLIRLGMFDGIKTMSRGRPKLQGNIG
jgi:hypothetical protein